MDILPPCEPTKVVCIGRNYADHAEEMDSELPDRPMLFLKAPNAVASTASTSMPSGRSIDSRLNSASSSASVSERQRIGGDGRRRGLHLRERRLQPRRPATGANWVRGKAFDGSAPSGRSWPPRPPPRRREHRAPLNGETKQSSCREHLISRPRTDAEITSYMTLEPGDVFATGTPRGRTDGRRRRSRSRNRRHRHARTQR